MDLKKQIDTIKNNWLILLLVFVLVVVMNGNFLNNFSSSGIEGISKSFAVAESGGFYGSGDFAPEVEDRIKTISSNLNTEIERGEFTEAEEKLKNILEDYDSFLLNENVRKSGEGFGETLYGGYTIKVDILEYDQIIVELKGLGEVESFSENIEDITGQYTDLELNLELEKNRLVRYNEMYSEAKDVEDKIELNDRIFNQERTIKYLEDRIDSLDKKVDYATIYFNMNEEQSDYANIVFVKFSGLVRSFVDSANNLLGLLFVVIPWIVFGGIVFWIYRKFRKN